MLVFDVKENWHPKLMRAVILLDGEVMKYVTRVEIDVPDGAEPDGPGRVTTLVRDEKGLFVIDGTQAKRETKAGLVKVLFAPKSTPEAEADQPTIVGG